MSSTTPLYKQEKPNTCALACLRMVLATFGTLVEESMLEQQITLQDGGTAISELELLARQFGLAADVREANVEQLRHFLANDMRIIAYIDRAAFDLTPAKRATHSLSAAKIHVVVITRISASSVIYHDPLPPARVVHRSIAVFRSAYDRLGNHCVVCSKSTRD